MAGTNTKTAHGQFYLPTIPPGGTNVLFAYIDSRLQWEWDDELNMTGQLQRIRGVNESGWTWQNIANVLYINNDSVMGQVVDRLEGSGVCSWSQLNFDKVNVIGYPGGTFRTEISGFATGGCAYMTFVGTYS